MNYSLKYENDIGSVDFSVASGFVVEQATSYGAQNVDFDTTRSNREIGETLQHQSVSPKTLTIRGTLMGDCAAARDQMNHVLAPLAKGRLIYNNTSSMEVYVKTSPDIERYSANARFSVSFYAPFPYWVEKDKVNQVLVGYEPQFMFPWNISDPNPFYLSKLAQVGYVTVNNEGEAPVGWTVNFLALLEAKNPYVKNIVTGEMVRVMRTMAAGEQVTISNEGEELSVTLTATDGTESDGFQYLDIASVPFRLQPGPNHIKTDADQGGDTLRASISFRPAYAGV